MFISFHTSMPSAPAAANSPTKVANAGNLSDVVSPGSPSTLSKILKPLPCASVMRLKCAPAASPECHRTCRLTQAMPAYVIRSGRENPATCPPSSKPVVVALDVEGLGVAAGDEEDELAVELPP